jgi:hypothetical protein
MGPKAGGHMACSGTEKPEKEREKEKGGRDRMRRNLYIIHRYIGKARKTRSVLSLVSLDPVWLDNSKAMDDPRQFQETTGENSGTH